MKCRHCKSELKLSLINLGSAPPSNAYLSNEKLFSPEKWFPLQVLVCESCWLVQTEYFIKADELFDQEYSYFSSVSKSWLKHAEQYVKEIIERFHFNNKSHIVEIASNDGYLLQYVKKLNIPCTGIEPTNSTAQAARKKGIEIVESFFNEKLAQKLVDKGKQADLIIANNVLAHVPDINDFVKGVSVLLKPNGIATFEFQHLLQLINKNQFDTIYHEHFSYLSLTAVQYIFERCDLKIINVEEIDTHGGSLRVWGTKNDSLRKPLKSVAKMLQIECVSGIKDREFYTELKISADKIKIDLLSFLVEAKKKGEVTVGYGAAAKGNTLLNFSGIDNDLISLIFDNSFQKQGKVAPGNGIPIHPLSDCNQYEIDNVIILPWNIAEELKASFDSKYFKPVNYYVAVPELKLI